MGFRPNVLISLMQFGLMGKRTVDCCGIVAMGPVAVSWSQVGCCGSVVGDWSIVGRLLWVGLCGLVVVDWLLWIGCCGSIAVIRLRVGHYGLVAVGPWLLVGCCGSVAMGQSL